MRTIADKQLHTQNCFKFMEEQFSSQMAEFRATNTAVGNPFLNCIINEGLDNSVDDLLSRLDDEMGDRVGISDSMGDAFIKLSGHLLIMAYYIKTIYKEEQVNG